jgi:biotin carboxyl carrier protein
MPRGDYDLELGVGGMKETRNAEVVRTTGRATLTIRIDGSAYEILLLKMIGNEIEFIMDKKYHRAKIVRSETHETRLLIDDSLIVINRYPRIQEILKESLSAEERGEGGEKNIMSQIPGRVVNIITQVGSQVKKGDPIVVLESMKMQVAVKAHKDGNIKQIKVSQGATVARYDVVAVLE